MENKQLQIAKDTVTKKHGYGNMEKFLTNNWAKEDIFDQVAIEYHRLMSEWNLVKNGLPDENKSVWLYNEKNNHVTLGCSVYLNNEGWYLAVTNGSIYALNGEIITEADIDDYEFTHWKYVDKLPQPPK